jgi:hypothetical protein
MKESLTESQLIKLAREIVMNIRPAKEIFEDYGIDKNDFYAIEKNNEFYKRVKKQYARDWRDTASAEDRLRISTLIQLEQLSPIITARAMSEHEALPAATEVGKLLAKIAGVGDTAKNTTNDVGERFVINIDLGGDTKLKFDKSIAVDANDVAPGKMEEW